MESRDSIPSLRASLDSNDVFVSGGHRVMKTAGATRHAERMKKIPAWALDDNKIKELIQRSYPGGKRRFSAGRLIRIIYLYYRVGSTAAAVAEELNMTRGAVIQAINRANETMNKPAKPRGRPRKNTVHIQETNDEVKF